MLKKELNPPLPRKWELFHDLSGGVCEEILNAAEPREFLQGEVLYLACDLAGEVFLLTSGCVQISQVTVRGDEATLLLNSPGELIGHQAMDPHGIHDATAQALQQTETLVWKASAFKNALKRFPALQRNTHCILRRHIYELEQKVCETSNRTASPRLAHTVLRLLNQAARKLNGQIEISVPYEIMAQMTAMTLLTVNRVLSKWEEQGFVSVRRGTIMVQDYSKLLHLCQASGPFRD